MKSTKLLIRVFFFFVAISMNCMEAQNNLILKFNDGSEASSLLTTLNKITFSGSNIVFNHTDASTSLYLIPTVRKITFGVYSDVPGVIAAKTLISAYPSPATDFILLKDAPEGILNILIIRMDGVVMINKKLFSNKTPIDISGLASGLYLLKINNTTLKFSKL